MADLKFELFITTENEQVSFVLDQKPLMLGTDSQCQVKMGQGDPTIKAIVQKEGDVLLVKIFDIKHPVEINGKKYKSAKIKNSSFFKIGNLDIVASIEEVAADIEEEFIEEEFIEEEFVDEQPQQTQKVVLPEIPQPVSLPEESPIPVDLKKEEQVPSLPHIQTSQIEEVEEEANSAEAVILTQSSYDDEFTFNIHFNESAFKAENNVGYNNQNYDYSDYIDLKDETQKELPQDIFEETSGHGIHIVHMNNGVVLEEEYFDPKNKRLFISQDFSDNKTIKILDCQSHKSELVFIRDRKVFVVGQEGYQLQKVSKNEELENISTPTVQLINEERVILTKGTSQIVLTIAQSPPRIIHNPFMNMDDKLIKTTFLVWALCFVPLLAVMLLAELPKQQPKIKKELVVIYKKKKVNKPQEKKKQAPQENEVAKKQESQAKKAETKKEPQKKVAKKEPVKKKVEKVVKKVTKKKPIKKVNNKKVAKVNKAKKVVKKVTKAKAVSKKAPKKNYKFSSSSKLSALVGKSSTKLKTARSTSSVNVASTFGSSSSSLTQSYNSKNFGKTGVKVDSFGGGSRSGTRAGVGTSGLSGKRGASTAYIEANTKILGAMDPELIRKIMKEYIPQFRYCYQKELMKNPSVAGTFDLVFQINAYGKGVNVGVKKNGKDFSRKAKGCLKRVVKMIKFPKPKGGGLVDVRQPMNFYKQ